MTSGPRYIPWPLLSLSKTLLRRLSKDYLKPIQLQFQGSHLDIRLNPFPVEVAATSNMQPIPFRHIQIKHLLFRGVPGIEAFNGIPVVGYITVPNKRPSKMRPAHKVSTGQRFYFPGRRVRFLCLLDIQLFWRHVGPVPFDTKSETDRHLADAPKY